MDIIIPKTYVNLDWVRFKDKPLFFLAGPTRCAGDDWQTEMCNIFREVYPECIVVCPAQWNNSHELSDYFVSSAENLDMVFEHQLSWKEYYLEKAGFSHMFGSIIFWFGLDSSLMIHSKPTQRAVKHNQELSKVYSMRKRTKSARVTVGYERGFWDIGKGYKIETNHTDVHESITNTALKAIRMAFNAN